MRTLPILDTHSTITQVCFDRILCNCHNAILQIGLFVVPEFKIFVKIGTFPDFTTDGGRVYHVLMQQLFVCLFFCCKYFNSMNKISVKLICPAIFLIIRVWCNMYMFISVTTYLQAPYTSWITGRGAGQPFVVSANITYAEGRYLYPLLYLHCKQNQKIYIVCVRNSLISKIWSLSKLLGCS